MDTANEEEIIRLEREAMEKELHWLVSKEVPNVLNEMAQCIQKCLTLFETSTRMVSFRSPRGSVEGFLHIEGWNVQEAEINIAFPRTTPLKTTLGKRTPWRLTQVHNAHNYLKLALELLEDFPEFAELKQVSDCLIQAKQELVLPTAATTFPKNLISPITYFHPSLPPEISVNINMLDSCLILTTYLLSVSPTKPPQRTTPQMGYSFKIDNKVIEVLDQEDVQISIPFYEMAFDMINKAYQRSAELRNKVTALEPN